MVDVVFAVNGGVFVVLVVGGVVVAVFGDVVDAGKTCIHCKR